MTQIYLLIVITLVVSACGKENKSPGLPPVSGIYDEDLQLTYLSESLKKHPDDAELLYRRANTYYTLGKNNDALVDLTKAVRGDENNALYYALMAKIFFNTKNYYKSVKSCEQALALGSKDMDMYILMAKLHAELRDSTTCRIYLAKAASISENHSEIPYIEGRLKMLKGDTLAALPLLMKSTQMDKRNELPVVSLAGIYTHMAKEDSAMYYILIAKERYNSCGITDLYNGMILERKQLYESAVHSYLQAYKNDSSLNQALLRIGHVKLRQGQYDASREWLEKYTKLEKDDKNAYTLLLQVAAMRGDNLSAIPYYEQLVRIDSTDTRSATMLYRLYRAREAGTRPANAPIIQNMNTQQPAVVTKTEADTTQ